MVVEKDLKLSWWLMKFVHFLKSRPVPKHIGFIMDGNRRFARNRNIDTIIGHEKGYESFAHIVSVGLELGVKEITTYALSIENLNRPKDELEGLWQLFEARLSDMIKNIDESIRKRVKVQIIGNISMMPENLQRLCAKIEREMDRITEPLLTCYLALCYTSRDEITKSMRKVLSEVNSGALRATEIDDDLLQRGFYVHKYPVDLIVRTSGETRLSDFLLWQCSDAVLYFTDVLWPEFGQLQMLKSVLYFQYCRMKVPKVEGRGRDVSDVKWDKIIEDRIGKDRVLV